MKIMIQSGSQLKRILLRTFSDGFEFLLGSFWEITWPLKGRRGALLNEISPPVLRLRVMSRLDYSRFDHLEDSDEEAPKPEPNDDLLSEP